MTAQAAIAVACLTFVPSASTGNVSTLHSCRTQNGSGPIRIVSAIPTGRRAQEMIGDVSDGMIWGRDESEWNELVYVTTEFLAEQARLQRTTTYTELNSVLQRRTGAHPFDFSKDGDRAAMGALLGEVARAQLPTVGALISSIVLYLNENDAGGGFYRLATDLKLLPPQPTADQRLVFWSSQMATTYAHYAWLNSQVADRVDHSTPLNRCCCQQ